MAGSSPLNAFEGKLDTTYFCHQYLKFCRQNTEKSKLLFLHWLPHHLWIFAYFVPVELLSLNLLGISNADSLPLLWLLHCHHYCCLTLHFSCFFLHLSLICVLLYTCMMMKTLARFSVIYNNFILLNITDERIKTSHLFSIYYINPNWILNKIIDYFLLITCVCVCV